MSGFHSVTVTGDGEGHVLTTIDMWPPSAVQTAVSRLAAIVGAEGFNPDDVYRIGAYPVLGQDLMCLVDVGRAALGEET